MKAVDTSNEISTKTAQSYDSSLYGRGGRVSILSKMKLLGQWRLAHNLLTDAQSVG